MSIVFQTQTKYNPYPNSRKYSFENWNRAVELSNGDPQEMKNLTHLVKGNFACFMNHLLDFKPGEGNEWHPWVPKRPTFKK